MHKDLIKTIKLLTEQIYTNPLSGVDETMLANVVGTARLYRAKAIKPFDSEELLVKEVFTADRITLLTSSTFINSDSHHNEINRLHSGYLKEIESTEHISLVMVEPYLQVRALCFFNVYYQGSFHTQVLVEGYPYSFQLQDNQLVEMSPRILFGSVVDEKADINIKLIFQKVLQFNAHAKTYRSIRFDAAEIVSMTLFSRSRTLVYL